MLIVSKWHDYYDVGMKMGMDKTVVYERKTLSVLGGFPTKSKYNSCSWTSSVLAFCGKFYPFVFHMTDSEIDKIVWNVDEALTLIKPTSRRFWDDYSLETESGIKKFFDRKYPELEKLFHQYRTPIFGFEPSGKSHWGRQDPYRSLVLNPNLKEIQFYKVKDPITAFQDIYMFVSGVLGTPPKPPKPIDDKIMAASKGHDGPYSFRKPPGKRGKNRWR